MRKLFNAVAVATAAMTAALSLLVPPSVSASPEEVTAVPMVGVEKVAISGPGFTPPPAPEMSDNRAVAASWLGPYTYRNGNSGKCMDILGASTASGAQAVQYTCVAGGLSQMWWEWLYEHNGSGYSRWIANEWSALCLQAGANNTPLFQMSCIELSAQIFGTTGKDNLLIMLYGNCIEVQGASKNNFARLVMWPCHSRGHQLWYRYNV